MDPLAGTARRRQGECGFDRSLAVLCDHSVAHSRTFHVLHPMRSETQRFRDTNSGQEKESAR